MVAQKRSALKKIGKNSMPKPKLLVITGPTGSGKTKLAIELAKQYDGEVVSADSRQVYKHLDIGTDKVTQEDMDGIAHYCIDVADLQEAYGAAEWKKCAEAAIEDILSRGKLPIVAGGTGYYIDILLGNVMLPEVEPNEALRAELELLSNEQLLERLRTLDPNRAETIEPEHKRRLIRAIEIAEVLGSVPKPSEATSSYDALTLGIETDGEAFQEKIQTRMHEWFERGFVQEVQNLVDMGISEDRINELGFEYKTVYAFIQKEISEEEMYETIVRELMKYVKRQKKWFRRNKEILWVNKNNEDTIHSLVDSHLTTDKITIQ